ncbi:MAG: 2-succinyl-6-hydroxy-2,4-cyclohexadiene-1-carboxylate synthase [Bacteroidetes bacterium SW_9_63_38]|nr:MAG: 2-succinyl-6-hydroxy-2,4-cyclohexadiene-1-carboxylate synthase [Bacteroidetes bacterium SW_9_63_38]
MSPALRQGTRSAMLHYQTHGAPEKRALCFLHGFMGSATDWSPIVEALETEAFCLTVDLPGHGGSLNRPSYEYSMEGTTQALADVLDAVGIERCTLIGYSMGGRVALYFSVYHPSRVQRLVLESASPGLQTKEARAERRVLDTERAERIQDDLSCFLHDWYRKPLFASLDHHDLVESMVERRQNNDPEELARALEGLGPGQQPSLWTELETVQEPTLVMTGAMDEKYEAITRRTAQRLPNARRVLVSRAGHNVHAERPQAYLAELCRFLDDT